jgi:hypothetical protein
MGKGSGSGGGRRPAPPRGFPGRPGKGSGGQPRTNQWSPGPMPGSSYNQPQLPGGYGRMRYEPQQFSSYGVPTSIAQPGVFGWGESVSGLETPGSRRQYGGETFTQGAGGRQWTDRYGRGWGTDPMQRQQQQFGGGPGKGGRGQPSPQQFPGGPGKGGGGYGQAQQQQVLGTAYQDFQRQREYPRQQLDYLSNMIQGMPIQPAGQRLTDFTGAEQAAQAGMPEYARPAYEEMMGRSAQEQQQLAGQQQAQQAQQQLAGQQQALGAGLGGGVGMYGGMQDGAAAEPVRSYETYPDAAQQEQKTAWEQQQQQAAAPIPQRWTPPASPSKNGIVGIGDFEQKQIVAPKDQAVGIGDFEQKQIADQPSVTPQKWTPEEKAAWAARDQAPAPVIPQKWTPQQKATWGGWSPEQQQLAQGNTALWTPQQQSAWGAGQPLPGWSQAQQSAWGAGQPLTGWTPQQQRDWRAGTKPLSEVRWTPAQQAAWRAARRANGGIVGLYWPGGRVH